MGRSWGGVKKGQGVLGAKGMWGVLGCKEGTGESWGAQRWDGGS